MLFISQLKFFSTHAERSRKSYSQLNYDGIISNKFLPLLTICRSSPDHLNKRHINSMQQGPPNSVLIWVKLNSNELDLHNKWNTNLTKFDLSFQSPTVLASNEVSV